MQIIVVTFLIQLLLLVLLCPLLFGLVLSPAAVASVVSLLPCIRSSGCCCCFCSDDNDDDEQDESFELDFVINCCCPAIGGIGFDYDEQDDDVDL